MSEGNEAEFMSWVQAESHRRELARLERVLARLERMQLASYLLMLFWTGLMFFGFVTRPDLVPAELAGIVTALVLFGGAFLVWHILRLKRETGRRMEAERAGLAAAEAGQEEAT